LHKCRRLTDEPARSKRAVTIMWHSSRAWARPESIGPDQGLDERVPVSLGICWAWSTWSALRRKLMNLGKLAKEQSKRFAEQVTLERLPVRRLDMQSHVALLGDSSSTIARIQTARRMSSRICVHCCLTVGRRHSLQSTGARPDLQAQLRSTGRCDALVISVGGTMHSQ